MAERYSSKRYLQDVGTSTGPKITDTSSLQRATGLRSDVIGQSLEVMKKFALGQMEKEAQRSGMRKALESDPYEIISQTEEGFLSYEDEVSRKHAMVALKNKTIGELQTGIDLLTQESLNNDESSTVLKDKITGLVNTTVKGLRDSGIDSPLLELEIRESIASPINSQIASYATQRAKFKQDLLDTETNESILNSVANAGRFGDNISIQKMNDTLDEHKDYINSKPKLQAKITKIYQVNEAKGFVDKAAQFKNYAPTNRQLRDFKSQVNDYKNSLPTNPQQEILISLASVEQDIATYEGKSIMSVDDAFKNRSTKSYSEYVVSEQKSFSTGYRAGMNVIDAKILRGESISPQDITELAMVIADNYDGMVLLDDSIKTHGQVLNEYANRVKAEFQKDERGFFARRADKSLQMIFNGNIDLSTLYDRSQDGLSLVSDTDIADIENGLDKTKPMQTYDYITNLNNSAGPYKNLFYGDVREKLTGDDLKMYRAFTLGDIANNAYGQNFTTQIGGGIELEATGIDSKLKTDNLKTIKAAINEVLPENLSSGRNKPGIRQGIEDAAFYYLLGSQGDVAFDSENVKDIVSLLAGNEETNDGQINGYVGNYYLDKFDRPNIFANAESINNGIAFLNDDTLPMYTFTLNPNGEFESFNNKVIGLESIFPQYMEGKGITTEPITMDANKIKTYFTIRNADPSDWGQKKLAVPVSHMGVFEDEAGNIITDERGNPILIDVKLLGHEYLMKGRAYDVNSSIKDYRYTIGGLKATKPTVEFAGGPGRTFDPAPTRNYLNELKRFRQQGIRNAE